MKYISTRQTSPVLGFEDVVLQGLADDGGLYIPESLPSFTATDLNEMAKLSYPDLVYKIISPFIQDEIPVKDLKNIIEKSYKTFSHTAIAPLKQISHNEYLLELFHGPTLAFKDFALQFLGNLFEYVLNKREEKVVIIGATSGDTGSAAIMGCKACKQAEIFILHPYNKVSAVQRKQMTSVLDDNVYNIAIEGNFDDCQDFVKKMFANQDFLKGRRMVAVNSINWVRIMVQIVYYFYAGLRLGANKENPVTFSVPTGNFGDIYAGFLAKRMGLPIKKLIVATNNNDILTRFINSNDYSRKNLIDTLSPSMNIQVSSNFERLLFDSYKLKNKPEKIAELMKDFEKTGSLKVENDILLEIRENFTSYSISDKQTCELIRDIYESTGEVVDPHSVIGIGAGRNYISGEQYNNEPVITLVTAHPAKFPEAIKEAGVPSLPLPRFLDNLMTRKERMEIIPNNIDLVKEFIGKNLN